MQTGTGQHAGVELLGMGKYPLECRKIGELADLTARSLITFSTLNPGIIETKQVMVQNLT